MPRRALDISGTPRALDELSCHECIGMSKVDAWTLHDGQRETRVSVGGRLMPNNSEVMRPLATLDLSIVVMPEHIDAE